MTYFISSSPLDMEYLMLLMLGIISVLMVIIMGVHIAADNMIVGHAKYEKAPDTINPLNSQGF